jgi:hypothetical protein
LRGRCAIHFTEVDACVDGGGVFDEGTGSCDGPAGYRSILARPLSIISWVILVLPAWIAAVTSFWGALVVGRWLRARRRGAS